MQERPVSDLAEIFDAEALVDEPGGRYNIAPTDEAIVVVERDDRRALMATAGDSSRTGLRMRASRRARSTPGPDRSHRCRHSGSRSGAGAPSYVDAFYEWSARTVSVSPTGSSGRTETLALAGLWAGWKNPETGEVRRTFTIVTTTPNAVVAGLHNRMPVIVPDEAWGRWLDPRPTDLGELRALLEPSDEIALEIAPASRLVNDVRNDGPQLLLALD